MYKRQGFAQTSGGIVLTLAADRLNDFSDVREAFVAFGVDELVDSTEARTLATPRQVPTEQTAGQTETG